MARTVDEGHGFVFFYIFFGDRGFKSMSMGRRINVDVRRPVSMGQIVVFVLFGRFRSGSSSVASLVVLWVGVLAWLGQLISVDGHFVAAD